MKLLHTCSNLMKLLSSEITFQSTLFPLKKIANYLDCPIYTVFLTVENSSQIILFILFLLMNISIRMLDNGSPIGWCRPTEQTVTKYRQQQR